MSEHGRYHPETEAPQVADGRFDTPTAGSIDLSDAELYDCLNQPRAPSTAELAVRAFFAEVQEARRRHGIPDVAIIVQARVISPHDGAPRHVTASAYYGDQQANELVLLARRYGEARATHEEALARAIESGRQAVRDRGPR